MKDNPTTIVIFGASGDLTRRKLVPALYNLQRKGRLPQETKVVGFARRPYSDSDFRDLVGEGVKQFSPNFYDQGLWNSFARSLKYFQGDLSKPDDYLNLEAYLTELEQGPADRLYYMATSPNYYQEITNCLGNACMADQSQGQRNIIIEKPFGRDLQSAKELNQSVHNVFEESQVYRIDHYLGKETAQNILFFRFANTIFEPLWNRNYISSIQITVAETVDVGHRAGYYDSSGVLRDMFQNHLLQLFTLVTMEPPASFNADALRNEKVKVLSATRPIDPIETVRAQYVGYRETEGVAPDSHTPTYAAMKLLVDNWRWQGIPFYLRSGKSLAHKVSEIAIEFMHPPHMMFDLPQDYDFTPNILSLCIQPDEGTHLIFEIKVPDSLRESRSVDMDFHYEDEFGSAALPEAYERLLLDALNGDASLFARSDEIELSWNLVDPLIHAPSSPDSPELVLYQHGSWGPAEAERLLARDGHTWRIGCLHE